MHNYTALLLVLVLAILGPNVVQCRQNRPSHAGYKGKFAYVALHYEGTPKDAEYVLGLRVLVKSIKLTSTYDVIVICSSNVSPETKETLTNEGAIVKVVDNIPNPFYEDESRRRTFKTRFMHTFNKLYLWSLTEYDRVIYFDSDNVVLYNIDELFLCGDFCAVYMNPIYFHTGLLVVKPDETKFNELLDALKDKSTYSYDGADQGFLTAQFADLQAAPLFDIEEFRDQGVPSTEPLMRLSIGYNINGLYFYNHFNWDSFRVVPTHYSENEVPALSMGYPIHPNWKPWYWHPGLFFDSNWHWQAVRNQLDDSFTLWFSAQFVLALVLFVLARYAIRVVKLHPKLEPIRQWNRNFIQKSPYYIGYAVGFIMSFASSFYFASAFIPRLTPADLGYYVFILYHNLGIYVSANLFEAVITPRAHQTTQSSSATSFRTFLISFVLEVVTLLVGWAQFHTGFIEKLLVMCLLVFVTMNYQAGIFKSIACHASSLFFKPT